MYWKRFSLEPSVLTVVDGGLGVGRQASSSYVDRRLSCLLLQGYSHIQLQVYRHIPHKDTVTYTIRIQSHTPIVTYSHKDKVTFIHKDTVTYSHKDTVTYSYRYIFIVTGIQTYSHEDTVTYSHKNTNTEPHSRSLPENNTRDAFN